MHAPPLVDIIQVSKEFLIGDKVLQAIQNVSLQISKGETLGLVGESGCGKSTLGRLLMRLLLPSSGRLIFSGIDIAHLNSAQSRQLRREMQIIFQDPYASLNPRLTVLDIIREPLIIHRIGTAAQQGERIEHLLQQVGLKPEHLSRYPHELSGGQRQRVGLARAVSLEPKFLVCDEPVSALDVSTQKQVLALLNDLKRHLGMTYLFISHDLEVIKQVADTVAVMYLGRIMEWAPKHRIFSFPKHPYTSALLSAIPIPDPKKERSRPRLVLSGELPSPFHPPTGCVFHTRCPKAEEICRHKVPELKEMGEGERVACHFPSL